MNVTLTRTYLLWMSTWVALEQSWILLFSFHKTKQEINEEYNILRKAHKNPDHFAPIYNKYFEEIFAFVFKRVVDEDVTADLTSIIFYKALHNIKKFKFKGLPFSAWLYRIAINTVNEHFRKQKKETRYISAEVEQIGSFFEDLDLDPKVSAEERIVELLAELNPKDLQIIELRFFENYSYREIGEIMGMSETNSKTKTFRILKKLKEIYKSKWPK